MWHVIRRKKDNLFYNNLKWVELEKARLFKRKSDVSSFLNYNCSNKGLASFNGMDRNTMKLNIRYTLPEDFEIIRVQLNIIE